MTTQRFFQVIWNWSYSDVFLTKRYADEEQAQDWARHLLRFSDLRSIRIENEKGCTKRVNAHKLRRPNNPDDGLVTLHWMRNVPGSGSNARSMSNLKGRSRAYLEAEEVFKENPNTYAFYIIYENDFRESIHFPGETTSNNFEKVYEGPPFAVESLMEELTEQDYEGPQPAPRTELRLKPTYAVTLITNEGDRQDYPEEFKSHELANAFGIEVTIGAGEGGGYNDYEIKVIPLTLEEIHAKIVQEAKEAQSKQFSAEVKQQNNKEDDAAESLIKRFLIGLTLGYMLCELWNASLYPWLKATQPWANQQPAAQSQAR